MQETIETNETKEINESNLLINICKLPNEIINIIKEFTPKKRWVITNRENYVLYHKLLKPSIINYENYIRDTIRRDNYFVFEIILEENFHKWWNIYNYTYKNMIFKNYLYFTNHYCIENDSSKCRNIVINFLKNHGFDKNLHKKNIVKYIRWKN
jgi:hypothetical protein